MQKVAIHLFFYSFSMLIFFFSSFIHQLCFWSNYSMFSPALNAISDVISGTEIICFTVILSRNFSQFVVNWGLHFYSALLSFGSFYFLLVHFLEVCGNVKGCRHKIKSHQFRHILIEWASCREITVSPLTG